MPPDFLNSREDAILIWVVVIAAFVLFKDARGILSSVAQVLRALLHPKLLTLFGVTFAYAVALVALGRWSGAWDTSALKPTIYWFAGTAAALAGTAVTAGARDMSTLVRGVIHRVFALTVVTEFVVNVYAMPLVFEIVVLFVVLLFGSMQAIASGDAKLSSQIGGFVERVLAGAAIVYIAYFLSRVLSDFGSFASWDTAQDFFVGPILTLALLPLLLAFARLSRWEQRRAQLGHT